MIIIKMQRKDMLEKISKVESCIKDSISFYLKDGYIIAETIDSDIASCVKLIDLKSDNVIVENENETLSVIVSPILINIIKKMPDGIIEITFNKHNVKIRSNDCMSTIKYIHVDKPCVSFDLQNYNEICIPDLKNILKKVCVSLSKKINDFKSGVNIVCKDGKILYLQTTDAFRISRYKVELINNVGSLNITIPGSTLLKIVSVSKDSLMFKYTDNRALLYDNDTTWSLRLFENKYPDIGKVIPNSFKYNYSLNKNELLDALDRCTLYNGLHGDIVKLELSDLSLMISKQCDVGDYKEKVNINNDNNEDLIIYISNNYMSDAIKTFTANNIIIRANASDKPICLFDDNNNALVHLILPVRSINGD